MSEYIVGKIKQLSEAPKPNFPPPSFTSSKGGVVKTSFDEQFSVENVGSDVRIYVADNLGHHAGITIRKSQFLRIVAPIIQEAMSIENEAAEQSNGKDHKERGEN